MRYLKTTKATDWDEKESILGKLIDSALFFIPRPNSENEKRFYLLNEWLIEFDDEGYPYREIGLDDEGNPIFAVVATDEEYGYWMDTNMKYADFLDDESSIINEKIFNEKWSLIRCAT